jgi:acyl-CoA thioesterase
MEKIRQFFQENDRLARTLGIDLVSVGEGTATARMTVDGRHLNAAASGHGGATFSLADFAFAAAVNSHGRLAVAIQTSISFVKAPAEGDVLTAEAREIALHPKLAVCDVSVRDQSGDLVASFQGTAYRKSREIPLLSS